MYYGRHRRLTPLHNQTILAYSTHIFLGIGILLLISICLQILMIAYRCLVRTVPRAQTSSMTINVAAFQVTLAIIAKQVTKIMYQILIRIFRTLHIAAAVIYRVGYYHMFYVPDFIAHFPIYRF